MAGDEHFGINKFISLCDATWQHIGNML